MKELTREQIIKFCEGELPSRIPANKDKIICGDESLGDLTIKPIQQKIKQTDDPFSLLMDVVGRDDLRPALMGVYFDQERQKAVASDVFIMVAIDHEVKEPSVIINPKEATAYNWDLMKETKEREVIDAKFPHYMQIVPEYKESRDIKVNDIISQIRAVVRLNKFFSSESIFVKVHIEGMDEPDRFFCANNLLRVLTVCAKKGINDVTVSFDESPIRALKLEADELLAVCLPASYMESIVKGWITINL